MAWGAAWPRHLCQGQNQTAPSNVGVFLGSSNNKICKSVNLLKHMEFDRQCVSSEVTVNLHKDAFNLKCGTDDSGDEINLLELHELVWCLFLFH